MRRVVVTGLGPVTPIGVSKDDFWGAVKAGKCGVDKITRFDTEGYACQIAAQVNDFDVTAYGVDKKEAKRMDLFAQFAIAASVLAVQDSGLDMEKEDKNRVGVVLGCGIGGLATLEEQHSNLLNKGPGRVSPFFIPMMISNMSAGLVAIHFGAKGPNEVVTAACSSGTNAVGNSFRMISRGDADVMLCGGCEATITPLAMAGFASMKALSTRNDNPKKASCPFDKERDGFVMGEGAGVLVLEELEHAKSRGAHIYCEVLGYGNTDDAYHITAPAPNGEGGARAMALAVADAGISAGEVDYINAHGTSTPYNDKFETAAIKSVFGEHAKELAVSSTKAMTGHMLGAAGGVEAIVIALAISDGYVPATINYDTPDEDCDLDIVPNRGRSQEVRYAMSNSLGFGGHNATVLFGKYNEK